MNASDQSPDQVGPKYRLFVDTNVMVELFLRNRRFQLEKLYLIRELVRAELLTTTITQYEFAKKAAEIEYKKIRFIEDEEIRALIHANTDDQIKELGKGELYLKMFEKYYASMVAETSRHSWDCLDSNRIDLNHIFAQYGRKEGMFEEGTKKAQFADAIVFEQMKAVATDEMPVIIFSRDGDFEKVAKEEPHIEHAKSWEELFELLNIEDSVPEMHGLVEAHTDVIVDRFIQRMGERFMDSYEGPDPSEFIAAQYIRSVVAEQDFSMRSGDKILVAGTVTISAELPQDYPPEYLTLWGTARQRAFGIASGAIEVSCKIEVTAIMSAVEKGIFAGLMEIAMSEPGGHQFMLIDWNVQE